MDIARFARILHRERKDGSYTFGLSREGVAGAFRELADRIEQGTVTPQEATIMGVADQDDFTIQTLVFVFAEKVDGQQQIRDGEAMMEIAGRP